jgi:uncharacterized protein with PQ loop repeat
MNPPDGRSVSPDDRKKATPLEKLLRALSVVTMLMTIPQVVSVWTAGGAGVSVFTWLTYLFSAVVWFVYGWKKRDKTIYLACIGWILLDAAIVAGVLVEH